MSRTVEPESQAARTTRSAGAFAALASWAATTSEGLCEGLGPSSPHHQICRGLCRLGLLSSEQAREQAQVDDAVLLVDVQHAPRDGCASLGAALHLQAVL